MLTEKIVSDIADKLGLPEVLELFRSTDAPAEGVNPLAEKLTPLQVFSQTDFDTRITTERQTAATEATRVATGTTYDTVDKRIKQLTGIDKLPAEAKDSLAYAERAFREKFGTAGTESAELQRMKDIISQKDLLITETQTKLTEMEVEHATEKKQTQINGTIDEPIKKLAINVPADQLASQQEYVKFRFNQAYTADVVDGKVQFTEKATGKVKTDPKKAGNPMDAETLIAQFAPTVVSLKTSQKRGAGVDDHSQNDNQDTEDLASYATIEDYKKALTTSGIVLASSEGQDKITKYLDFRKTK